MSPHLKTVVNCIQEANAKGSLKNHRGILTGFSGESLYGTLQRLSGQVLTQDTCYLEIGVFQGLTLLSSALAAPEHQFYGIDNFAFFDSKGENETIIKARAEKLNISNAHLINADYEDALENLSSFIGNKKVGIYFIDGPHDYRSQLMCLLLIQPYLADRAVILIDDSNYRHVRQANRDFLASHPEFKLLYQAYTKAHPMNLTSEALQHSKRGWWNGINVLYKDVNDELDIMFPPTVKDKTLFENEHVLHACQYPEMLPVIWRWVNKLRLVPLFKSMTKPKSVFSGKYKNANTYSDELPLSNFNKSVEEM